MLKSLAFVPPEEVPDYFEEIKRFFEEKRMKKVKIWFEATYIDESSALFKLEFWPSGN